MNKIQVLRNSQYNQDWREWAIDVVGAGMFFSGYISDLYDLIKSRRADTIKEALNKYGDEVYKVRMAEMQAAVQRAAETTAEESIKQTAKMNQMAKDTHKIAKAAQRTTRATTVNAIINYGTYRNTKKINKKL